MRGKGGGGMMKAKAVGNAVYLGEEGDGELAVWDEPYPLRAQWVAEKINQAIIAVCQDGPHPSGEDGTERLCQAVYGRRPEARDWLGGSEARMLHAGADLIERLKLTEEAARHYRFAGSEGSLAFLRRRGWTGGERGLWHSPENYPTHNSPASFNVALAIELELALGCHK